jgi:hypothetical protein
MNWITLLSAVLATLAAGAASIAMGLEYARSRRPHAACWTISLALFSLASAILAVGEVVGWSPWLFRLYYMVGAVLVVPWMTLGAVWLFGPIRLARVGVWMTIGLSFAVVAVSLLSSPKVPTDSLPELKDALESAKAARGLAMLANAGGTPVAIFLLLRAASTYRRKRVLPNKASGAIIVSIGIAAAAVGGMLAVVVSVTYLAPSLAVGAVLMLAGFRRWSQTPHINAELAGVPT